MRRLFASWWFFFFVLLGGWALFWWIDCPPNGYADTQGSLMPPVIISIVWPWLLLCCFAAVGRR